MSKMKTCWVTGWLLSRLECRINAREHSTRSGILLHFSQTQGALYTVRDPSTLFANSGSTLRGQGSLYTLCSNYENSGSILRSPGCQESSNTLCSNYENSGSTLRGQGSFYPLFAATLKTQGAFYGVGDPLTHSAQQL
jgi:hypothetical protein